MGDLAQQAQDQQMPAVAGWAILLAGPKRGFFPSPATSNFSVRLSYFHPGSGIQSDRPVANGPVWGRTRHRSELAGHRWRQPRPSLFRTVLGPLGRPPSTIRTHVVSLRFRRPVPAAEWSPIRLSLSEREEISRGLAADESLRGIAQRLGRAASTVSRRGSGQRGPEKVSSCGGASSVAASSPASETGQACHPSAAPGRCRGETRVVVVSSSDLAVAR